MAEHLRARVRRPTVDRDGFRSRRARLGRQAGAQHLGASLFEVEPGIGRVPAALPPRQRGDADRARRQPCRCGRPTASAELAEGEVVALPGGEAGAHQVDQPRRRARADPDHQRDERARRRRPAGVEQDQRLRPPARAPPARASTTSTSARDAVELWDGEEPPPGRTTRVIERIGVAGAGTMGAGIAQLAAPRRLRDPPSRPDAEALERGLERLSADLDAGPSAGAGAPTRPRRPPRGSAPPPARGPRAAASW